MARGFGAWWHCGALPRTSTETGDAGATSCVAPANPCPIPSTLSQGFFISSWSRTRNPLFVELVVKSCDDFPQGLVEILENFLIQAFRYPEAGLSNASRNRREGVRVPAKRDSEAQRILEARGLQRGGERLGAGSLAGYVEGVIRPDFVTGSGEVVSVAVGDFFSHRFGGCVRASAPDSSRRRFRALDSFGVVVGRHGTRLSEGRAFRLAFR